MKDKNGMDHSEENGQFTSGDTPAEVSRAEELIGAVVKTSDKPIELGTAYDGYKDGFAVEKLVNEGGGYVPGAFHREDVGDIDLIWGDESIGLMHIIKRRRQKGKDIHKFLGMIPRIIRNGANVPNKNNSDRFDIVYEGYRATVRTDMDGKTKNWLLTSFEEDE